MYTGAVQPWSLTTWPMQSWAVEHEVLIRQVLRTTSSSWYTVFVLAQSPIWVAVKVPLTAGS